MAFEYQRSVLVFETSDFKGLRWALRPLALAAVVWVTTLSATPGQAQTPVAPPPPPVPSVSPTVPPTLAPSATPATPRPVTPLTPSRLSVPRTQVPTTGYQEEEYRLGPGDQIGLDIFDVPELSGAQGQYVVLIDGSVNLPWVGKIRLQGLTLSAASDQLENAYAPFIRNPLITVNLLTARTLRVNVVGAVKRPGSYIISPQGQTNQILVSNTSVAGGGAASQWPTVTQALQQAGGITQLANLREVQVNRPQPDGSQQTIKVNLWELLRSGQIQQDVALRDRDTLVVPQSAFLSPEEALLNGSSSFAPATILVNVVGEVKAPGTVEVAPNTSLNQALLTAGGFESSRARRKDVILVRLNPDGTAVRRTIPIDLTAGINEETNPSLREFDTIVVGRSGIAQTGDTLDNFFRPLGNIFGIFNVFDIFNND
ncbi:MAG: polysaccharide export protein [Timaviella obliquedivisa GSE-PSE-MK23-08B]|nr:polysaccharide export protein [Timaviella obliquedivisa GSE-PSE-MK23-08B]